MNIHVKCMTIKEIFFLNVYIWYRSAQHITLNILEFGDSDISHSEITVLFDFIHYSIFQTK